MWSSALVTTRTRVLRARSRRTARTRRSGALENGLTANDTTLRTRALHRPSGLSLELPTRLARRRRFHARRRSRVNRARTCLRRDHTTLRNNRLSRSWLRRHRRRGFGCCRLNQLCRCGGRRRDLRRSYNNRRGLTRSRRRSDDNSWRRGRFLNLLRHGRSWRWRDNRGRLSRCWNHNWPRCWRFWRRLLNHRRRRGGNHSRRRRLGWCGRRCRRFCHRHGARRRRWMFLLSLPLFQQLFNVAGLGNPGEIDLRPDLTRGRFSTGG